MREREHIVADYEPAVLRRLQLSELSAARIFFDFCAEHGLAAVGIYGTALGAVRHQGFIPWDDDMDMGMPRADYERFLALADALPDTVELKEIDRTPGYTLPFAKVCLKNTTFLEASQMQRSYHSGIFVDVFPLDEAAADEAGQRSQIRACFLWARLCALAEYPVPALPEGLSPMKEKLLRGACRVGHGLLKLTGQTKLRCYRRYVKAATGYPGTGLLFDAADARSFESIVPEGVLFPPIPAPFEGADMPMPADMDAYCTAYFGDYMTLPAPADRHNHPPAVLDFEKGAEP